jgi:hypothetical protein
VVEMMNKRIRQYGIVYLLCVVLIAAPLLHACEEHEQYDECNYYKTPYKDINKTADSSNTSVFSSASMSFLDVLLERYPLLNQIIEMILTLLYNWLSSLYYV